jgi:hypothetical protein
MTTNHLFSAFFEIGGGVFKYFSCWRGGIDTSPVTNEGEI